MLQFLLQHRLFAINTFFKKAEHRKWTWISPNGNTKNEINFIITDRKQIVTDVTVLNRISISSDHRIIRSTISLNLRKEKRKLTTKCIKRLTSIGDIKTYQKTIK